MRRTKEDAEKTKAQLLDAALKVFKKKGYKASNLADIAKEANVTRGAIAWHFTNKQTLYRRLIEGRINNSIDNLGSIMELGAEPNQTIFRFVEHLISNRYTMHLEISILNNLIKEKPEEFLDLYERIQKHFSHIIENLEETITNGIAKNIFKPHLDPDFSAKAIFTFLWGFFTDFEILYADYSEKELTTNIKNFFDEILILK